MTSGIKALQITSKVLRRSALHRSKHDSRVQQQQQRWQLCTMIWRSSATVQDVDNCDAHNLLHSSQQCNIHSSQSSQQQQCSDRPITMHS